MAQRAGAVSALFTAEDAPADTTLQLEDYPPCAILPGSLPEDPMEAQPLTALSDIRVDACFIGGCSSGRIEELREAAEILRGHHIRRELRLLIGFASNTDYLQAMEEGLIDVFLDCGAQVTNPGCASCLATSIGVIGDGEVMPLPGASTTPAAAAPPLPGSIWFLRGLPPRRRSADIFIKRNRRA